MRSDQVVRVARLIRDAREATEDIATVIDPDRINVHDSYREYWERRARRAANVRDAALRNVTKDEAREAKKLSRLG